jgi:hypothetical protein
VTGRATGCSARVRNNSIGPEGEAALAGVVRSLRPGGPGAQSGLDPATGGVSVDGLDGSERATLLQWGDVFHGLILTAHDLTGRRSRRAAAVLDLLLSPADLSESSSHTGSLEALLEEEAVQLKLELAEIRAAAADTHRNRLESRANLAAWARLVLSLAEDYILMLGDPPKPFADAVASLEALTKAMPSGADGAASEDGAVGGISSCGGGSGGGGDEGARIAGSWEQGVAQLFGELDASVADVQSALLDMRRATQQLKSQSEAGFKAFQDFFAASEAWAHAATHEIHGRVTELREAQRDMETTQATFKGFMDDLAAQLADLAG